MIWQCDRLAALTGIAHGFFGREGGVSTGIYSSLNCGPGSGDDPASVEANRRIVMQQLGAEHAPLLTCAQIHSNRCIEVDAPWEIKDAPEADAMVTAQPDIALGILTADCVPVLFADAEARIIGAAHAGWKGAVHGVLDAVITHMVALGASKAGITATLGPSIAEPSYEIGQERYDDIVALDADSADCFRPGAAGKWQFDLKAYVLQRLAKAGVDRLNMLGVDTYANPDTCFSFRRTTHRGEADYGRQVSVIMVKKDE